MKPKATLTLRNTELGMSTADKLVIIPLSQEDMQDHKHDFFELAYITGGSCVHTLNDMSYSVAAGDYFIVDYGSVHRYTDSKNLTLINCLFLPEIIDDTLKGCCSFETLMHACFLRYYKFYWGKTPVNRIFHDKDGRIGELLNGLMKEYQEKQVGYREVYKSKLQEILIIMMRNVLDYHSFFTNSKMVSDVIEYIKKNYQSPKILDEFSRQYHFTPQYISRKFKQETGVTIRNYQQKVRMEKCCELLVGSDMPAVEIAHTVGYHDYKFFGELFKRMLKMTPSQYRKISADK
ncbi:AraC family transcriptional regulator [Scatolibacter rhodanostii]|uniref:AraC family transcriptional regulator n=1 Tax=Scatolibacter rhodanostii TaxID=2014781 RepID=UPI000C071B18|nr:AraC family transcriptional regulator [Scatolibacter rhodanostii]